MPVFALFFPVPIAVASTAVVHAANNVVKLLLLQRHVRGGILLRFGLPAVAAAFVGAALLGGLAAQEPLFAWSLGERTAEITPVKLVMGLLILGFACVELAPGLTDFHVSIRWLPLGGVVSGFFGGLSGHQGAFRAAFLAPLGLSPPEFAATQAVLACLVDAARLAVYGVAFRLATFSATENGIHWPLVGFACACAFAGAVLGRRLLPSVTIAGLRRLTGTLLLVVGFALASGLA